MSNASEVTLTIDGEPVVFVRKDSISEPGPLTMLVLHRGFIFVGKWDGKTLRGCQNVRKWSSGGFGGLTLGAKSSGATLDACCDMTPPNEAVLNVLPLHEGWENA